MATQKKLSTDKLDTGKLRLAEFVASFGDALMEIARLLDHAAATKYEYGSWKDIPNAVVRYDNATMRHFFSKLLGMKIDPDDWFPHDVHQACDTLITLQLRLNAEKKEALKKQKNKTSKQKTCRKK